MIQTKQPLRDIENMPYWKFEAFIERLNKHNHELKKQRDKQMEEQKNNSKSYKPPRSPRTPRPPRR
jgi:hypothetical protein